MSIESKARGVRNVVVAASLIVAHVGSRVAVAAELPRTPIGTSEKTNGASETFPYTIHIVYSDGSEIWLPAGASVGLTYPPKGSAGPTLPASFEKGDKISLGGATMLEVGGRRVCMYGTSQPDLDPFRPPLAVESDKWATSEADVEIRYADGSAQYFSGGCAVGLYSPPRRSPSPSLPAQYKKGSFVSMFGVRSLKINGRLVENIPDWLDLDNLPE